MGLTWVLSTQEALEQSLVNLAWFDTLCGRSGSLNSLPDKIKYFNFEG